MEEKAKEEARERVRGQSGGRPGEKMLNLNPGPPTEGTLRWQVTVPAHNTVTLTCTCDSKVLTVCVEAGKDDCSVYFEWVGWGCVEGGDLATNKRDHSDLQP